MDAVVLKTFSGIPEKIPVIHYNSGRSMLSRYDVYTIVSYLLSLIVDCPLRKGQQALLKFKASSLTPKVVKVCLERVGFKKCSGSMLALS